MRDLAHTIDADQLGEWGAQLGYSLAEIDWRPAFAAVSIALAASAKENFFGGHTPEGAPWAALKRPRSGKRHAGSTPLPLRNTGLLMAATLAAGAEHVDVRTDSSMEWGSSVEYAGWQNFGTRTIPARQFVGWSEPLLQEVEAILLDYAARQAGAK